MATIKKWLNAAGFNWERGRIIYQSVDRHQDPGWADPVSAEFVDGNSEVVNREFYSYHGSPNCPRFIAEDDQAIFFPDQYDGATNIVRVEKEITRYLDPKLPTPYPGG